MDNVINSWNWLFLILLTIVIIVIYCDLGELGSGLLEFSLPGNYSWS